VIVSKIASRWLNTLPAFVAGFGCDVVDHHLFEVLLVTALPDFVGQRYEAVLDGARSAARTNDLAAAEQCQTIGCQEGDALDP